MNSNNRLHTKKRKNLRLDGHDYSSAGFYFVTVCVDPMKEIFGEVKMCSGVACCATSVYGKIVEECWHAIPNHFSNVRIDGYAIMPDHIHGIINIQEMATACSGPTHSNVNPTLITIIQSFKSAATRKIRLENETIIFNWQRSFHDRIIRNPRELSEIQKYISENPARWLEKHHNLV